MAERQKDEFQTHWLGKSCSWSELGVHSLPQPGLSSGWSRAESSGERPSVPELSRAEKGRAGCFITYR